MKIVSRIATREENYIAISQGEYGKYVVVWCTANMIPTSYADMEQWVWATTWGTPLEHGQWVIPNCDFNVSFEEDEMAQLQCKLPTKVSGEMIVIGSSNLFKCELGVFKGNVEGVDFIDNGGCVDLPYHPNSRTTADVWDNEKRKTDMEVSQVTVWFKHIPKELTPLEELAINRLSKDGKDNYNLIRNIESYSKLGLTKNIMFHDGEVRDAIKNEISKGNYSVLYSLFTSQVKVGNVQDGMNRSNSHYYNELALYFLSTLNSEQRTKMFLSAKLVDVNAFVSKYL